MKNQYFADTRDLFKYDLVLEFLAEGGLSRFTFIPMLTKDEPGYGGGRTDYSKARAGTRRTQLAEFLTQCLRDGRRDIRELERFVEDSPLTAGVDPAIYMRNGLFTHQTRGEYFDRIDRSLLERSVILLDPDIGLGVKSMVGREERYVTYEEVRLLFDRMDERSILIVFQFIPRVSRRPYISRIQAELSRRVARGGAAYWLSDNQIVLYVLAKGRQSGRLAGSVVHNYAERYGLLSGPREGRWPALRHAKSYAWWCICQPRLP